MNEPRPSRPRVPGSQARRPVPLEPPALEPSRSGPGAGVWIAIGLCAVVGVAVAVVAMGGKQPSVPEPVVTAPPPPKLTTPKPPAPPVAPVPAPKVQSPPAPPVQPPPPPKKAQADPVEMRKAELAELAKQRRLEGEARLAEARENVQKDLDREQQEAKAFEKRFADLRLDVKLTTKQEYKQAAITGFTPDELRIRTDRDTAILPWSMVEPETVVAVATYVYRGEATEDLLALARFYVDRRLWKEAQSVLHRLKRVDEEQAAMADKFDEAAAPLLTGKGLFQGALKTKGASGLRLFYDFSDPSQGDDFKGRPRGITIENGKMTLAADKAALWVVGDNELEFWEELEFEATVSVQGALLMGFHQRAGQDAYIVEIGPAGTAVKKGKTVDSAKDLARNANAVLKGDQKIRVSVRRRRVSVSIAGRPALAFEDPATDAATRGVFLIGVADGKAVFGSGLVIDGQVNPDYLRKKIGTIEMEARRSVSKDLGEIRELNAQQMADRILGAGDDGISADMLFLEFNSPQELPLYQDIKQVLARRLTDPGRVEKAQAAFEDWLSKRAGFPSLWYLKGIRHFNQYELGEARDCFEKAVGLFPQFFEAHYQIGRAWWFSREFAKSIDACARALEIRPDYANAHVLMGQMLFAKDKKASMEADFSFRLAEKLNADAAEMLHERRRVRLVTRGPRDLGCIHELESAHYRIVTDISAERAAWYASQLEVVRASYLDAFKKWYGGDSRPKPRIAIFNTREAFYTYTELSSTDRRENLLGFFDPANNELVLFEDLELEDTLQVLYHEAFHHFASAMLKFPPYWWNEGIAEYMSAVKLDPQGKEIKERARILGRLAGMKMALAGDFFIPFEKIMNYSPAQFYSGMVGLHYAQAWTMIHFLYEYEKGRHRRLIEQYFDELVQGKTQRQAYDAVFAGKTEQLEKDWLKFTKALKPPKK